MKSLGIIIYLLLIGCSAQAAIFYGPAIVISDRKLVSESLAPDGVIQSNEVVTFSMTLSNAGDLYAPNVTAVILATNGITPLDAPRSLGTMTLSEVQTQEFTFRVTSPLDRVVQLQMSLLTNDVELSRNFFDIPVGTNVVSASRLAELLVPVPNLQMKGPASEFPSVITFSNISGSVSGVRVTLHNYRHEFPEDVNVVLVSPQGTNVMLMSDCGGFYSTTNVTLTFDSGITNLLTTQGDIRSGRYSATDYNYPNYMDSPAPTNIPPGTTMNSFMKLNPNGAWSLYVDDVVNGQGGYVFGGWSLTLIIQPPPTMTIADNHDGRFRVNVNNTGKRSFLIDFSPDCSHWTNMGQTGASVENAVFFDTIPATGQRFYRARRLTE